MLIYNKIDFYCVTQQKLLLSLHVPNQNWNSESKLIQFPIWTYRSFGQLDINSRLHKYRPWVDYISLMVNAYQRNCVSHMGYLEVQNVSREMSVLSYCKISVRASKPSLSHVMQQCHSVWHNVLDNPCFVQIPSLKYGFMKLILQWKLDLSNTDWKNYPDLRNKV